MQTSPPFQRRTWVCSLVAIPLLCATAAAQVSADPPPATSTSQPAQDLANQVNNPAAPLTYIQIRDVLLPHVAGADGATNTLQVQPVLPIGREHDLPFVQLLKVSFPIVTTLPNPIHATGTGDLDVFDLISVKAPWGRWGVGVALVFPTASAPPLGAGKWQAGPAGALIYTGIRNLTLGMVLQNPISYAGDHERARVNSLLITPTVTYSLEEGWFVGLSDYNWTFDWEKNGAATIALGVQIGKITNLHRHPISLSIEVGGAAVRPGGTPNPGWIIGFEVTPIFKWHLGEMQ